MPVPIPKQIATAMPTLIPTSIPITIPILIMMPTSILIPMPIPITIPITIPTSIPMPTPKFSDTNRQLYRLSPFAEWAPLGAERFVSLAAANFFDQCRFFRVLKGFVAQFGINGDPAVQSKYKSAKMQDDPVTQSNTRGTVVFATSGKNSRTTQVRNAFFLQNLVGRMVQQ